MDGQTNQIRPDQTKPDQPSQSASQSISQLARQPASVRAVVFVMILGSLLSSPPPRGGNINCVSRPAVVLFSHALVLSEYIWLGRGTDPLYLSLSLSFLASLFSEIVLSLSAAGCSVSWRCSERRRSMVDLWGKSRLMEHGAFKSLCALVHI